MLEKIIRRVILRLFPELTAKAHLPIWGVVVEDATSFEPGKSTAVKPLYVVDVQLLNDLGEEDKSVPVLKSVPLPVNFAANDRGIFGFPKKGTYVEIGFLRGLPSKPFVRTVLVENQRVPQLSANDVLIQQSENCFQRGDGENTWTRFSSESIRDEAKNYEESITEIKRSLAGMNQHIEVSDGGTVYLGSESENVLQLLSELIGIVDGLAGTLASHTHLGVMSGPATSGVPQQASNFSSSQSQASGVKSRLDPMVE